METPANQAQPFNVQATANASLPNLRFGDSGDAVRVLQRLLLNNRYAVKVDGVFGALTETAVKAFQSQRNLKTDGIVGQRTWRDLAS
jgi:peptidoglycan hydrolase-like protein with peptidoglycan-binding domain